MKISLSSGRFTSGIVDAFASPAVSAGAPIVIYGHGAGGNGTEIGNGFGLTSIPPIIQALVKAGFLVIAPTATEQWGNSVTKTRYNDALTWARTVLKASDDPPSGVGASHGCPSLLNYSLDYPLTCMVGLIPAIDLQAIRVANTGGLRTSIDNAFGVVYPADLPAGANPTVETEALSSLPMNIWYSDPASDAFSENVPAFITATGAEGHNVGMLGHTNASILAAPPSEIVDFIKSNI